LLLLDFARNVGGGIVANDLNVLQVASTWVVPALQQQHLYLVKHRQQVKALDSELQVHTQLAAFPD